MNDHDAQEAAVAYECARECIVHMMAIYTDALHHASPTPEDCAAWRAERARLAGELRELCLTDHAAVARRLEGAGILNAANGCYAGRPDPGAAGVAARPVGVHRTGAMLNSRELHLFDACTFTR